MIWKITNNPNLIFKLKWSGNCQRNKPLKRGVDPMVGQIMERSSALWVSSSGFHSTRWRGTTSTRRSRRRRRKKKRKHGTEKKIEKALDLHSTNSHFILHFFPFLLVGYSFIHCSFTSSWSSPYKVVSWKLVVLKEEKILWDIWKKKRKRKKKVFEKMCEGFDLSVSIVVLTVNAFFCSLPSTDLFSAVLEQVLSSFRAVRLIVQKRYNR